MNSIVETSPSAHDVKLFHEASRLGWMEAKRFLQSHPPELCERIMEARLQQRDDSILHDPIEDHPDYSVTIKAVEELVSEEVEAALALALLADEKAGKVLDARRWPLGTCHLIWRLKKERLAGQGITWYSPSDLNPGACFD